MELLQLYDKINFTSNFGRVLYYTEPTNRRQSVMDIALVGKSKFVGIRETLEAKWKVSRRILYLDDAYA